MSKAKSGWFKESQRHRQARMFGKATPKRVDYIKGGLADKKDYSKFNQKQLNKGIKVELEHTKNPLIAREIAGDHLSEDPKYYDKLKLVEGMTETKITKNASAIRYEPLKAPLAKQSTELPIQFRITVPSTTNKNEPLTPQQFTDRIRETAKELSKKFGGETTIRGEGGYVASEGDLKGNLITEKVAVVETSMKPNDYKKNKLALSNYIKKKKTEWGQESIGYGLEGEFYVYPKFD